MPNKEEELVAKLLESKIASPFDMSIVSYEALDQMIKANQLKYIEAALDVVEEQRLRDENIDDFKALSVDVQKQAAKVAEDMNNDPEYFNKHQVDVHIQKAVQIALNIRTKSEEIRTKNWTMQYRSRLVCTLQGFIENFEKPTEKKGFFHK